jgi:hypothetical protein
VCGRVQLMGAEVGPDGRRQLDGRVGAIHKVQRLCNCVSLGS